MIHVTQLLLHQALDGVGDRGAIEDVICERLGVHPDDVDDVRIMRPISDQDAATCDYAGGGCASPAAPEHRLCEWHQGYNEAWKRISDAIGGFPITVYVDDAGRRVAAT